jgi:hypothetical protein
MSAELPQEWWDVSTDQNTTVRVSEATKCLLIERARAVARGEHVDPYVETVSIIDNPLGIDVRTIDAWGLSTPETREKNRSLADATDDEADEHERLHERGKYKPKQWTPDSDDD